MKYVENIPASSVDRTLSIFTIDLVNGEVSMDMNNGAILSMPYGLFAGKVAALGLTDELNQIIKSVISVAAGVSVEDISGGI